MLKAYSSRFVYLCICNSHFLKDAKKPSTGKCSTDIVQQYLELNSLRFLKKAQFVHCLWHDCSPRTPLWHVPDFSEDKSTRNRFLSNLKLGSIQQLQLLTAKLHAISLVPNRFFATKRIDRRVQKNTGWYLLVSTGTCNSAHA